VALSGYGGAANYIRKAPVKEAFANAFAIKTNFAVTRLTSDVNAPLNDRFGSHR
jgi:iron complex outermembrane receptor protein